MYCLLHLFPKFLELFDSTFECIFYESFLMCSIKLLHYLRNKYITLCMHISRQWCIFTSFESARARYFSIIHKMVNVSLSTFCCHNGNVLLIKSITIFLLGTTFFNSFCIILKWHFINASSSPMGTKAGRNGIDKILDFGVDGMMTMDSVYVKEAD